MRICIREPKKLSNTQKKQNSWVTTSKPSSTRKTPKTSKTFDIRPNIWSRRVNLKRSRSFMNKRREIYARFSWNLIEISLGLLKLMKLWDIWFKRIDLVRKKQLSLQMRSCRILIKTEMVWFLLKNFQTNISKSLRNWDIDKLSVRIRCWNLMNNTNIAKAYLIRHQPCKKNKCSNDSAYCTSSRLETYQVRFWDHILSWRWKDHSTDEFKPSISEKRQIRPLKIQFTTGAFNLT